MHSAFSRQMPIMTSSLSSDFSQHLTSHLRQLMRAQPDCLAQVGESYQLSWGALEQQVDQLACALLGWGVGVQEMVGLFAQNLPEWTHVDLACQSVRSVSVPIYATSSAQQTRYILRDAEVRLLFVGEQEQLEVAETILAAGDTPLQQVVVIDPKLVPANQANICSLTDFIARFTDEQSLRSELKVRLQAAQMDDLITLIYTSGTTGEPKGVMLDYANVAAAIRIHQGRVNVTTDDLSLCFLPLSHVFERAWSWNVLAHGACLGYCPDPKNISASLKALRPTLMCAVPRFFEKIYSAIIQKMNEGGAVKRRLFSWALRQGQARWQSNGPLKRSRALKVALAERLVFSKIRTLLGGRLRYLPCGGARLDHQVDGFFQAIGLPVVFGYGMTETCGTVSCYRPGKVDVGSVGSLLSELQVKLGCDNEVLVKGPTVMRGYYKKPDATAATMADGWLKTGDAGTFDASTGLLCITERLKELMKTSGGKYIAPQLVEGTVGRCRFIEQVAVVGDDRKFVSALIVPNFETLELYAQQLGLEFRDRLELIRHSDIVALFQQRLEELQHELARFEKVKRFTLLPHAFSIEGGELTPTLKLRRNVILQRFKMEIESMYQAL